MDRVKVVELAIDNLREAAWNPNVMDEAMLGRLRESVMRFGTVQNLVVRLLDDCRYEVLSGNQRFRVLREMGITPVPSVVVDLDDGQARLLAQALNRIQGEDDLGLKAEAVREILKSVPASEVLSLLPESAEGLEALGSLGEEDIASHLQAWELTRKARLKHMIFQLSGEQVEVVEKAMRRAVNELCDEETNPNRRGNALYRLCRSYLGRDEGEEE